MEFSFEVIEAEVGLVRKPLVLDFTPEDFDEVEFGAVGWEAVQSRPPVETSPGYGLERRGGYG